MTRQTLRDLVRKDENKWLVDGLRHQPTADYMDVRKNI